MRFDNWLEAINHGLKAAGQPPLAKAPEIGTTLIRDKNRAVKATVSVWDVEDKFPYLARISR